MWLPGPQQGKGELIGSLPGRNSQWVPAGGEAAAGPGEKRTERGGQHACWGTEQGKNDQGSVQGNRKLSGLRKSERALAVYLA